MSKFLLFWKRTRVFLKFRFLIYKFQLLKFLGKFIPYFKPMYINEDKLLSDFKFILKEHLDKFNKYKTCIIDNFEVFNKSSMSKSLTIKFEVTYLSIDFSILMLCENFDTTADDFELLLQSLNKDYSQIKLTESKLLLIINIIHYLKKIDRIPLLSKFRKFDEFFER